MNFKPESHLKLFSYIEKINPQSSMDDNEIYKKLVYLLTLFKNRPNHLAKFLIENEALSEKFYDKIKKNKKLEDLEKNPMVDLMKTIHFVDISQMKDFFNSLVNNIEGDSKKNEKEFSIKINKKLDECIRLEKYEEAIRIRDYMKRNNIKRSE